MKIFINPGHGGNDPGAVSKNGLKESEVCANICNILANKLKVNGYSYQLYQQNAVFLRFQKKKIQAMQHYSYRYTVTLQQIQVQKVSKLGILEIQYWAIK